MAIHPHKDRTRSGLTCRAASLYHAAMGSLRSQTAWCSAAMVAALFYGTPAGGENEPGRAAASRAPRTWVVALDGTGQYQSIQEAVEHALSGDTIQIKAGEYREDVIIHSKDRLRLVGEGTERVKILGRDRFGVFHIGKWPYGATHIEISGVTINERGGLAVGLYNGRAVVLRDVRVNGLLFGQQVQDVRIERCVIGGSETTGVQFADSQALLVDSTIHDNDHGVTIGGNSDIRLVRNIILRNLYEGVVVTDSAHAVLISNTIVKNGRGVAFLGRSRSQVTGNIVGLNRTGFVLSPSSQATISYNALYNSEHDYLKSGSPNRPAPELKADSDMAVDPRFVDPDKDDFRLRPDTPLTRVGGFPYLGALAPTD